MKKKYSYAKVLSSYEQLRAERSEWEAEWRQVSEYLLPGRGIYQTYSKPRKRKLTSPKVINSVGEDSLYVLTSGMHGGLTSPSRPWFKLEWADPRLNSYEPLKTWLSDCEKTLHGEFHKSNFYSVINSFYIEYAGFGTACTYVGEDTGSDDAAAFRFELLTAGEYAFAMGADGRTSVFYRTIFMTPRQLVDRFPDTASNVYKEAVRKNESRVDTTYVTVLESIYKDKYKDKPFTRIYWEVTSQGAQTNSDWPAGQDSQGQQPLEFAGYYEFPYPLARWNTIGSDTYGIGPGSRALPDIKRAQEMEKAFLMAAHKGLDPPVNAPARMKGKLVTLPGGRNYYSNPDEMVRELYQVRFDGSATNIAIDRVEQRIQKNFFNDIFLTGSRDPNASPLKARQVDEQSYEKMLRLGPVIERLSHEYLQPLLERCFNICMRKELFEPLSPDLAQLAGDYKIVMVSPLATAQRAVALQGISSFMAFTGQIAQFDQRALDKIDVDGAIDEFADITGVSHKVLNSDETVQAIRQQREQQMAEEKAKAEAAATAEVGGKLEVDQANASNAQAQAGLTLIEGQSTAMEAGLM